MIQSQVCGPTLSPVWWHFGNEWPERTGGGGRPWRQGGWRRPGTGRRKATSISPAAWSRTWGPSSLESVSKHHRGNKSSCVVDGWAVKTFPRAQRVTLCGVRKTGGRVERITGMEFPQEGWRPDPRKWRAWSDQAHHQKCHVGLHWQRGLICMKQYGSPVRCG